MNIATLACRDHIDRANLDDLDVVPVADLCRSPPELNELIGDADRLVLVVDQADLALAQVQQCARSAGVDPLGIQYVAIAALAGDRAGAALAGATARALAFPGSRPEHARPTFSGKRSRRDMLTFLRPHYEVVPDIDRGTCAADSGCRACVGECPAGAYEWVSGTIRFDRDACVTCGRCVSVCPVGAISNPSLSPTALSRQISAMVATARPEWLGVAFVCRQRTRFVDDPGWVEVELPCVGMAPATWPVAALLLGAAAAAVVPCGSSGCPLGNDQRARHIVMLASGLLASAGLEPAAVATEPTELIAPLEAPLVDDPFATHGPVEVALALQAVAGDGRALTMSGSGAGRGVVTLDASSCTLCLACADTCPTGALDHAQAPGEISVTFDAALCTGCAQCFQSCPEQALGAIQVESRLDTVAIGAGRITAVSAATASCEVCGAPVASTAMLARIADLLGREHAEAMSYLERRCMECRGVS